MKVSMLRVLIPLLIVFVACGKKTEEDPNLAFSSLSFMNAYGGASPSVPFTMVNGYSLNVKNGFLGLNKCENPNMPEEFISDSAIKCSLLTIFRDQDNKSILTPGLPIYINDTSTVAYWIDISEAGKLTKLASFDMLGGFGKLRFCGLKDGYLWATDGNATVNCYNLNLAKGKHMSDISTLKVASMQLEGIVSSGFSVEKDNMLYMANGAGQIYCIDISIRSNPIVKSLITEQSCRGLELSGSLLMSKANNKLLFVDISDPLHPLIKGRMYNVYGDAKFHNGFLYTGFKEMKVYDISNSAKPKLLKVKSVAPYEISDYQFWGEYIYCKARTYPYFTPASYPLIMSGNRY